MHSRAAPFSHQDLLLGLWCGTKQSMEDIVMEATCVFIGGVTLLDMWETESKATEEHKVTRG